jgi:hypothetical protein
VEIAGAFFTFAGDEAIEASTWTSIVTGTTAYIVLTASGTAGSQIVAATYTATAPTWRDDLQGWYASAASSARVVGSVYKAEATSYYPKTIYNLDVPSSYRQSGKEIFTASGVFCVPLSVNKIYLTGCAAGGNGGNGITTNLKGGGGGGGGEIIYKKAFSVTPGSCIPVIIGAVGAVTSFGTSSFNFGANGSIATSSGASGGAGGALVNGTCAGVTGGSVLSAGTTYSGTNSLFAYGGGDATYSGGGAGGLGAIGFYYANSSGGSSTYSGGAAGMLSGGGGGGGTGSGGPDGANGGNAGYGGGGGGGGSGFGGGSAGTGGAGGPAILIVEW